MVHLFICKGCVICRDGQTEGSFAYNNFPSPVSGDGCAFLQMDGSWSVGECLTATHVLCKRGKLL